MDQKIIDEMVDEGLKQTGRDIGAKKKGVTKSQLEKNPFLSPFRPFSKKGQQVHRKGSQKAG